MLELINPIATASSLTTSRKCMGFDIGSSTNGSVGTFRSAATRKSTNLMPAANVSTKKGDDGQV